MATMAEINSPRAYSRSPPPPCIIIAAIVIMVAIVILVIMLIIVINTNNNNDNNNNNTNISYHFHHGPSWHSRGASPSCPTSWSPGCA